MEEYYHGVLIKFLPKMSSVGDVEEMFDGRQEALDKSLQIEFSKSLQI
jgi:hypothetical protein